MSKVIKDKIEKLYKLINYHNDKYFVDKNPEISDTVFDQLVRQLQFLENKHPEYKMSNSPTQKIGETFENNTFETIKHIRRMPSLSKSMTIDELCQFAIKLYSKGVKDFVFEPKIDGLALSLRYEKGHLKYGITRGDGEYGDDITQTAMMIKDIPKVLPNSFTGEIRGEAYMKKSDFITYNETRRLLGLKEYANTRNLAAGILKRKEVTEENSLISFLAYGIYDDNKDYEFYSNGIKELDKMGFNTSLLIMSKNNNNFPEYKLKINSENHLRKILQNLVEQWIEIRPNLDFDIDGLVLKADKISDQELFGETQHSPNWATAFKFPAEEAITILKNVEWSMGTKGNITPNARIEPVELMGVTISNITLHNLDELKRLDIMIGDTITISRRGDVIPKVENVVKELRTGEETPIQIPEFCPIDGAPTKIDGAFLRCSKDDNCEYMQFAKIKNFIDAMEIDDLGPTILEKILEANIISDLADLYDIQPGQIETLERMGKRSANKIIKNIQSSRSNELYRVIAGLTIKNVSISTAKDLASYYKGLEALLECKIDELETIPDIGPKTAMNIYEWCQKENNRKLIYKLIERNVGKYEEQQLSSNKLNDKVFCFTGAMVSYKRKELEEMVINNGGKIGGVNKKLNYLVTGEKAGSKLTKAQEIGTINIITESQFLEMLK